MSKNPQVLIWWGTPVEICSALARLERDKLLSANEFTAALATARQVIESWQEIVPSDAVRLTAERLLRVHGLRTANSLQLAAALIAADHEPANLDIVYLDTRLITAAELGMHRLPVGNSYQRLLLSLWLRRPLTVGDARQAGRQHAIVRLL